MAGKRISELIVGEQASFSKTIAETDVYLFAGITGDFNPLHVDAEYARGTIFQERIAHGGLTTALAAGLLGTRLPGLGTVALELAVRYLAPVRFGDTLTVTAEVAELVPERNRVRMLLRWSNQRGDLVSEGHAWVSPPR